MRLKRYRNGLTEVLLTDRASGVDTTATRIDWGAGSKVSSKRTHRYASGARPKITITVRDKAGNKAKVTK